MKARWDMSYALPPDRYMANAGFVPVLGSTVFEWLDPQPGERILDVGCGEGTLTARIAESGASVVGIDRSTDMVAATRARGIDAHVMPAEAIAGLGTFDAVFSNAALHWVRDADGVLRGIRAALRPGGRFVAEFGGHGNIAAIATAIRAVVSQAGYACRTSWFYPTADEYRAKLVAHDFSPERVELVPRPTPLPTGIRGWLETFGRSMYEGIVPAATLDSIESAIEDLLRPALMDRAGRWTADYVRLRVVARAAASDPRT